MSANLITATIETPAGPIPRISGSWTFRDFYGSFLVRTNIGRENYKVDPGLYAVGTPDRDSDVIVTSNYKLTFDVVRRDLDGLNVWLTVLDTKGVNVWCAAGKGTFGTKELLNRIEKIQLEKIISHKRLIVPQLGATGISAHEIKKSNGFTVIYGPVRSADLKEFIRAGYKASKAMRTVTFNLRERAKLITNDFMYGKYYLLAGMAGIFLLSGLYRWGYSTDDMMKHGLVAAMNILLAYSAGIILSPILLPWLPFRTFSMKGLVSGLLLAAGLTIAGFTGTSLPEIISWFLIICPVSSFMMMNFTGSSTYTSLSGVQKEMKLALPIQISSLSLGFITFIILKFF